MGKEYINMSNPSLDDVFRIDQLLHQLASYEVTGGRIVVPSTIKEAFELQKKTAETFNYFKALIQRGECSVDFFKNKVLKKNGPFPKEPIINIADPNLIDKITTIDKEDKIEEKPEDGEFVKSLLKMFSAEMSDTEREDFLNRMGIKTFKVKIPLPPPKELPEPPKPPYKSKIKTDKKKKTKPSKKQ